MPNIQGSLILSARDLTNVLRPLASAALIALLGACMSARADPPMYTAAPALIPTTCPVPGTCAATGPQLEASGLNDLGQTVGWCAYEGGQIYACLVANDSIVAICGGGPRGERSHDRHGNQLYRSNNRSLWY